MGNYPDFWKGNFASPLRDLMRVHRGFDRFFDDWGLTPAKLSAENAVPAFAPSCEVSEDKNQYLLKFDLPGLSKDQIKIEVDENRLTVSGERKEDRTLEGKGEKKHFTEVYYGSFVRSFTLPTPISAEKVQASFENGVLSIALAKAELSKSRQISIK